MTTLSFNLKGNDRSDRSFGTLADFVSGLYRDRGDAAPPSLSEYFTSHGVDAGIRFHQGPGLYIKSGLWDRDNTTTPTDGQSGPMSITRGNLTYGAEYNESGIAGFVEGRIERQSGQGSWTAPVTSDIETNEYDDDFNVIGTTVHTDITKGYHSLAGPVTALYAEGYANTKGEYELEAGVQHQNSLQINERDIGLHSEAAIGVTNDMGAFAQAGAQMRTLLDPGTRTYAYVEGGMLVAQNAEYNGARVGTGIVTSALNHVNIGAFDFLPAIRIGMEHDLNSGETNPTAGLDIKF